MRIRNAIPTVLASVALAASPAIALDPQFHITQYRHTAWRVQEGAFDAAPNAIAQTTDGYLWIGTDSGLVRYDGVHFIPWKAPEGARDIGAVYSLLGSSDGTLWIGTARGLFSWKNNTLQEHLSARINGILEDPAHRIWATRSRAGATEGGLCEVAGENSRCFGADDKLRLSYAGPLAQDRSGNLWIGGSDQLVRWTDRSFDAFFRKELASFRGLNSVNDIKAAEDGTVWVAIPVKGFGLFQIVGGVPRKQSIPNTNTEQVDSLFFDRDRSLWMGTVNDGIYRLRGTETDRFRSEDGLSSNAINGFYQDREGNLWVATSKGLDCFRDNRVVTFSRSEGLGSDLASSVLAADNGDVWIGNRGSLDLWHAGAVTSHPIPGHRVTSLWQDSAKRLWVGIDNKLTVVEHGGFREILRPDGSSFGIATSIAEDNDHNIWVATAGPNRKIVQIRNTGGQEDLSVGNLLVTGLVRPDPAHGIWIGLQHGIAHYAAGKLETFSLNGLASSPTSLTADPDGSLWITSQDGILRWKDGEAKTMNSKNGLPCNVMTSSIRDNRSDLWIYSRCGMIRIADAELQRWWKEPASPVKFQFYDVFDGAVPGTPSFSPMLSKSRDGRLWFATGTVVQMIDPEALRINSIPPPVYIEALRADHTDYATKNSSRLPAHTQDVEIDYTALSFVTPEKDRFRYTLAGSDKNWHEAGTRRQAFYTNLGPGAYRFRVAACNNDGVWNQEGASLNFTIAAAYYQTEWFRAALVAFLLVTLWALYRYRLRLVAHEFNLRLEERVAERTRVAREVHDTLLQSFQGLMLRLQAVSDIMPDGKPKDKLEQSLQRGDQAVAEARTAVYNLRASAAASEDLPQAVKALGEELANSESAEFRLVMEGPARELRPILREEIYLITREALQNAFMHAHARHIEVEISYEKRALRLRVRDDGEGIPREFLEGGRSGHYGLSGMRERAKHIGGKLDVWSGAGAGTEIELVVASSIAYAKFAGGSLFSRFRNRGRG